MEHYQQPKSKEQLQEAADRLAYDALAEIATKYGTGDPSEGEPVVADLAYHNLWHSWGAKDVSGAVAKHFGLDDYDVQLARLIASAHDVIHESTDYASAEELSAEWLVTRMRDEGFGVEDQEIARLSIIGTTPLFDPDRNFLGGQLFQHLEFPSERARMIALSVASADLGSAYTYYGPTVSHHLFKEMKGIAASELPVSLDGLEEFEEREVLYLENLHPLHPDLEQVLGGLREQGLWHHKLLLQALRAGRIASWADVEAFDEEYAQRWSPNI